MIFDNTYELPLNKSYVRHWGVLEAVRELIQNALDSDSPFLFEFDREDDDTWTLMLNSSNSLLTARHLLLGTTSKADNPDMIGSFGEGFKIALLVLTREDRRTIVVNGEKTWTAAFKFSKHFGDDILCITESKTGRPTRPGLTFHVGGLTDQEVAQIRESCLQMQQSTGEIKTTSLGTILLDKPGRLYVGGLFIVNTELKYGYNVLPQHIELERDRKTVSDWDLKSVSSRMWLETKEWKRVAEMIEAEVPDVESCRWSSPDIVKEECYALFRQKNPTALIATSHSELQAKIAQGMKEYVYVGSSFGDIVSRSSTYRNEPRAVAKTPQQILQAWFDESRRHMHHTAVASFREVMKQAEHWHR